MDHVIGGKFKLGRKIGSGSFGELYLGGDSFPSNVALLVWELFVLMVIWFVSGINVQTGEEVAVKLVREFFICWRFPYFIWWYWDWTIKCNVVYNSCLMLYPRELLAGSKFFNCF